MEQVWRRIVEQYYKEHPSNSRFQNITLSMFWTGSDTTARGEGKKVNFPSLKGKGAEIRSLMPALKWVWEQVMDQSNPQHEQVHVALQCSVYMDDVLDMHKDADVIPPPDCEQFKHAAFAINTCMNSLCTFYAAKGLALFNITPKNHYLCHIGIGAAWLNPRLAWCYAGEDFMRHIRRMGAGVAKGTGAELAGKKMMLWYSHALGLTLS